MFGKLFSKFDKESKIKALLKEYDKLKELNKKRLDLVDMFGDTEETEIQRKVLLNNFLTIGTMLDDEMDKLEYKLPNDPKVFFNLQSTSTRFYNTFPKKEHKLDVVSNSNEDNKPWRKKVNIKEFGYKKHLFVLIEDFIKEHKGFLSLNPRIIKEEVIANVRKRFLIKTARKLQTDVRKFGINAKPLFEFVLTDFGNDKSFNMKKMLVRLELIKHLHPLIKNNCSLQIKEKDYCIVNEKTIGNYNGENLYKLLNKINQYEYDFVLNTTH